jgi:hypothetical protein
MRKKADGASMLKVSIRVFCSRSDLAALDGFIKPLRGITTGESALVLNSAGPDGGYFPFLKITGKALAIAKALKAFLAAKKDTFSVECGPDTLKVNVTSYSEKRMAKLIEKGRSFDMRHVPAPAPKPDKSLRPDWGVIEGFAAKPKRPRKRKPKSP